MSKIKNKIIDVNGKEEKALTIFLTAGYPNPEKFVELVVGIGEAGADILEIGLPFSDSLADGTVIQKSYTHSLKNEITLSKTLDYISQIKARIDVPILLMSSSNPILNYGKEIFCTDAVKLCVDGLIIPDVPLEEYDNFFNSAFIGLDKVLLTTPTSSEDRIKFIDKKSSGFLYCVSVTGTTGVRQSFDEQVLKNLERTYKIVKNNKMQIGFGISTPEDVKRFSPFCDGVIVGSAVIKSLENDDEKFSNTINLVRELKAAC